MDDANKCRDCGYELDYSAEDVIVCHRCDSDEYKRMYEKAQSQLTESNRKLEIAEAALVEVRRQALWIKTACSIDRDADNELMSIISDINAALREMGEGR